MEYDFRLVDEIITRYNITYNDMISINLEMYKRNVEKLIKDRVHTSKITEPKAVGGMWCTYVYDENNTNHRKCIQARTEEGFYKSLYAWYYPNGDKYKKSSIANLLEEVIEYKKTVLLNDEETIKRFRLFYKSYYKDTDFAKKQLSKITSSDCEDFFNTIISKGIKEQAFNGIIGVANATFDYAKRRLGIIKESPLENAHINRKLLVRGLNETDEERVYFEDEKLALFEVIKKHLLEDGYSRKSDLYAILLGFKLGLRIGEMTALKFSDISYRFNEISIKRMEKSKTHTVVEHTKTYEMRKLPLSEYELNIFERIKELNKSYDADEDYIFINEDGRRWQRGIDNTLRVLCREANIPEKSFHDIRRTVASEMYENGRTLEEIRDYLGHRDIMTTQGYIYRLKRQSEYAKAIHESLKGNELMFD